VQQVTNQDLAEFLFLPSLTSPSLPVDYSIGVGNPSFYLLFFFSFCMPFPAAIMINTRFQMKTLDSSGSHNTFGALSDSIIVHQTLDIL
jgi:hypothetical protein